MTDVRKVFDELRIGIENFQVSAGGDKSVIQFEAEVTPHQEENVLQAICKPGVTCEMVPIDRQNG
jgi:hypothetical protein